MRDCMARLRTCPWHSTLSALGHRSIAQISVHKVMAMGHHLGFLAPALSDLNPCFDGWPKVPPNTPEQGYRRPCVGQRIDPSKKGGAVSRSTASTTCLGRTCLKWSADGSLSQHDHDELMKRLCSSDPALAKSDACKSPSPPFPDLDGGYFGRLKV